MFKNLSTKDVDNIREKMNNFDSDLDIWTGNHGKETSEGLLIDRGIKMVNIFANTEKRYRDKDIDVREDMIILRNEWYEIENKWKEVINRKMC